MVYFKHRTQEFIYPYPIKKLQYHIIYIIILREYLASREVKTVYRDTSLIWPILS